MGDGQKTERERDYLGSENWESYLVSTLQIPQGEFFQCDSVPPAQSGEKSWKDQIGLREPIYWVSLGVATAALLVMLYGAARLAGSMLQAMTGLVNGL